MPDATAGAGVLFLTRLRCRLPWMWSSVSLERRNDRLCQGVVVDVLLSYFHYYYFSMPCPCWDSQFPRKVYLLMGLMWYFVTKDSWLSGTLIYHQPHNDHKDDDQVTCISIYIWFSTNHFSQILHKTISTPRYKLTFLNIIYIWFNMIVCSTLIILAKSYTKPYTFVRIH